MTPSRRKSRRFKRSIDHTFTADATGFQSIHRPANPCEYRWLFPEHAGDVVCTPIKGRLQRSREAGNGWVGNSSAAATFIVGLGMAVLWEGSYFSDHSGGPAGLR